MNTVNRILMKEKRAKPTLWLLPYDAEQIDSSALYHRLAKNQQQRFNALRGKRKIEFGATRLFLQYCLQLAFQATSQSQQNSFNIIEKENLPPLVPTAAKIKMDFGISHSKQLIAIITATMESENSYWGLDVEQYRQVRSDENAKLFCNESQLTTLKQASAVEYNDHYYRFWTQKEAVLKAKRLGIIDAQLTMINGILCQENQPLRSSQFINPIDNKTYAISAFCKDNIDSIQCKIMTMDENLQFTLKQPANLQWQHYRLNI